MGRAAVVKPMPGEMSCRDASASEEALALVPSMTFLVHEAHRKGLDEITLMLSETLANMTRWIEENRHA